MTPTSINENEKKDYLKAILSLNIPEDLDQILAIRTTFFNLDENSKNKKHYSVINEDKTEIRIAKIEKLFFKLSSTALISRINLLKNTCTYRQSFLMRQIEVLAKNRWLTMILYFLPEGRRLFHWCFLPQDKILNHYQKSSFLKKIKIKFTLFLLKRCWPKCYSNFRCLSYLRLKELVDGK